jgi:hypothetical protein
MKDPSERQEGGFKKHKMVHIPPSKNKERSGIKKLQNLLST